MNIQWHTTTHDEAWIREHFAFVDKQLVGRVGPRHQPHRECVYVAELRKPKVVVLGNFETPDEAKQAVEDAVKERL